MVDKSPVLLTTSRRPTGKIRAFCRDLSSIFPNIIRINRGKLSLEGVAEKALDFNAEKVIIVGSWKRGLGKIQLFEVNASGLNVVSPLMYMKDAKLLGTQKETWLREGRLCPSQQQLQKISHLILTDLERLCPNSSMRPPFHSSRFAVENSMLLYRSLMTFPIALLLHSTSILNSSTPVQRLSYQT